MNLLLQDGPRNPRSRVSLKLNVTRRNKLHNVEPRIEIRHTFERSPRNSPSLLFLISTDPASPAPTKTTNLVAPRLACIAIAPATAHYRRQIQTQTPVLNPNSPSCATIPPSHGRTIDSNKLRSHLNPNWRARE